MWNKKGEDRWRREDGFSVIRVDRGWLFTTPMGVPRGAGHPDYFATAVEARDYVDHQWPVVDEFQCYEQFDESFHEWLNEGRSVTGWFMLAVYGGFVVTWLLLIAAVVLLAGGGA